MLDMDGRHPKLAPNYLLRDRWGCVDYMRDFDQMILPMTIDDFPPHMEASSLGASRPYHDKKLRELRSTTQFPHASTPE
jgi:hypothetical protein